MANALTVEGVSLSGKTKKKTSVFWSTVPENEQFKNVQVPGVAMGGIKDARKDSQTQKFAQVVQKSKSDSAILNTRTDLLTVNKPGKSSQRIVTKQDDFPGKKKDVSSLFKGATSCGQLPNMSSLSESSNPRRASLKNLNVEDKKRVANLIKELAKTGEERELALERLQEERVSFEEQLGAIQEEQTVLKKEKESLKQRLEMSEKQLKKYESELRDVKSEKEEQKILKKRLQAQPQGTQTSPSVETLSKDVTVESRKGRMKKTHDDKNSRHGRMQWGAPQVPVYSNSLFDVKVSDVEYEQNGEPLSSNKEEYERSGNAENGGLHELYLREYSLQLRLQEQQIEIQRQQVQLQQQLQLLQQQQFLPSQGHEHQPHAAKQGQLQHEREISSRSYIQQQHSQDWSTHASQHGQNVEQKQSPLNQSPYGQSPKLQQQNNEKLTKHSPNQQTNVLQKRESESRGRHVETNHRADAVPHDHLARSQRNKHDRHARVMETSRHEDKDVLCKHGESQARAGSPPLHNHYHHLGHDGGTNSSFGEYDTSQNKGTGTQYHHSKHRHITKRKSSRKDSETNDVNQVDFNNNQLFQPKSNSPTKKGNHLHDGNGSIVQDHPPPEYISDSYSETDDQRDMDHHCRSHRSRHCGHYHEQSRQDQLTSEYDHPVTKHVHYQDMPQHDIRQTSPHILEQKSYHKDEPRLSQMDFHAKGHQRSPNRTNVYYQTSMQYTNEKVDPPLGYHHEDLYSHHGRCEEHSLQQPGHHAQHHVKHKHTNRMAPGVVTYQASRTTCRQYEPAERRGHVPRPLDFPGNTKPPSSGNAQVGMAEEYDYLLSSGFEQQNTRVNESKSKDSLDDYIHNHDYNTKSDPDYPRKKMDKNPTKRKTSRLKKVESDDGFFPPNYTTRRQPTYEEEHPSYSLYGRNIHETASKQFGHPIRSYSQERQRESGNKSYPDSLVDIVEDLQVHTGHDGYSGETRDMYSTVEREYNSDEEESTILDNIFFLKR